MAEVVKELPPNRQSQNSSGAKHPWSEWLDGRVWKLKQGVDFSAEIRNFRSQVFCKAKERQRKVKTRIVGEYLYIQATKE